MKIGIISDIHDNLINLEKCLSWCDKEKIGQLICLGDLTNSESLEFLAANFTSTIHLVRGNIELYEESELEKYKNIKYYGKYGVAEIDSKTVGICHEPYVVDRIISQGKCDIIFYGHTHKPWFSEKEEIKLVNPGTLGGMFNKATFAVWNTEKDEPELKILEEL